MGQNVQVLQRSTPGGGERVRGINADPVQGAPGPRDFQRKHGDAAPMSADTSINAASSAPASQTKPVATGAPGGTSSPVANAAGHAQSSPMAAK